MAKRKAIPPPPERMKQVLTLRGSDFYADWLSGLSRETLIPVASIVRDALKQWAQAKGLPSPPER